MYHYLTNKAKDHLQIRKEFYLVEMYTLNEFTLTVLMINGIHVVLHVHCIY